MDFIITVCDNAAGEECPYWPGNPAVAHWGFPDPSLVEGSEEKKRQAYKDVMVGLKKRIDILADLPEESMDSLNIKAIHHQA
jgi:arsenate reductase